MQKILIAPHPALRKQAKTLDKVTKVEVEISKQMIQTMKNGFGAGLSANQIGILKKIITVHIQDKENNTEKLYALFNPEINEYSKDTIVMEEGCLSFPQQFAEVERPTSIKLQYTNEKNNIVSEHEVELNTIKNYYEKENEATKQAANEKIALINKE